MLDYTIYFEFRIVYASNITKTTRFDEQSMLFKQLLKQNSANYNLTLVT